MGRRGNPPKTRGKRTSLTPVSWCCRKVESLVTRRRWGASSSSDKTPVKSVPIEEVWHSARTSQYELTTQERPTDFLARERPSKSRRSGVRISRLDRRFGSCQSVRVYSRGQDRICYGAIPNRSRSRGRFSSETRVVVCPRANYSLTVARF